VSPTLAIYTCHLNLGRAEHQVEVVVAVVGRGICSGHGIDEGLAQRDVAGRVLVEQDLAKYLIQARDAAFGVASPARAAWQPSAAVHTGAAEATELTNGTAQLALRFTSVSGSTRIDDVYLDPRRR
jgi:hypothetical protein